MSETRKNNTAENAVQTEKIFTYKCDASRISAMKKGFAALVVLMTAAFMLTGSYSCRSMGDIAVLLSWILYLVPLLLAWIGLFTTLRLGESITLKQQKKGPSRLLQGGAFAVLISAASVFSCIYFLVTGEYESVSTEIGMVVRVAVEFLAALGLAVLARYNLSQLEE